MDPDHGPQAHLTPPSSAAETIDPGEETLAEALVDPDKVTGDIKNELDHMSLEVMTPQTFLTESGEVDLDKAEQYKNVIPANLLDTLNQIQPGVLFDLFVEVTGDHFEVNFAGNVDADDHIGLSQLLRGTPQTHNLDTVPLEGIRALRMNGSDVTATREGLAGNFYASSEYQEVYSTYSFVLIDYDEGYDDRLKESIDTVRKQAQRLPVDFLKGIDWSGFSSASLAWNTESARFEQTETPTEAQFAEYVMIEAQLSGVDPHLALAIVAGNLHAFQQPESFENKFQWTLRALKEYEHSYPIQYGESPKKDGHYTAEFVARAVTFPMALDVPEHDKLLANYGNLIGQTLELPPDFEIHDHGHDHEFSELDSVMGKGIRALVPNAARISSHFGFRNRPRTAGGRRGSKNHKGIDIAAASGSRINSYADGVVSLVRSGPNMSASAGNYLEVRHPGGFVTRYMHCTDIFVKEGDRVSSGQKIATVGSTGNSSGPHLHFEIKRHGIARNPEPYLTEQPERLS